MSEKSHINTEDDSDVTLVKSSDGGLSLDQQSPVQNANTTDSYPDMEIASDSELVIGSVVKNTYELVEVLGEGGMGTVFKALNKVWAEVEARDPYVAIKVLKPELSENKQLVRSLYSDFDRTKMLANCPNIIKVHGFDRDGYHVYMTMEYLTGKTLGDYLNHNPMGLAQAWFIIEGIGNALAYAHEHNIVHRDIKPDNVRVKTQFVSSDSSSPANSSNGGKELSVCATSIAAELSHSNDARLIVLDRRGGSTCATEIRPLLSRTTYVVLHKGVLEPDWWEASLGLLLRLYQVAARGEDRIVLQLTKDS